MSVTDSGQPAVFPPEKVPVDGRHLQVLKKIKQLCFKVKVAALARPQPGFGLAQRPFACWGPSPQHASGLRMKTLRALPSYRCVLPELPLDSAQGAPAPAQAAGRVCCLRQQTTGSTGATENSAIRHNTWLYTVEAPP